MSKIFFRANEFKDDVIKAKYTAFERGLPLGFHSGHEAISFKIGYTTYLYAFPAAGKSTFINDILINLALTKNTKTAIYSPETGKKETIVASLIQTYLGKKMHGSNKQVVTVDEYIEAIDFIDNHFVILEPNLSGKEKKRFSFKEVYNTVHLAQEAYGWDIELLVVDPFNYIHRDESEDRLQTADYVLQSLMFVTDASKKMGLHTIIVTHLQQDDVITDKDTGIEYMPKPHPSKIANGQNFWRTGYQMIGLWKCPEGVIEKSTGFPYPRDSTDVMVQKSKPFGAGRLQIFRLKFNDDKQKFYETIDGKDYYVGEYEKYFNNTQPKQHTLKPSTSWYETDQESCPF